MKRHLVIYVPCEPNGEINRHVSVWSGHCVLALPRQGWSVDVKYFPGKPVCSTRNQIVHDFLETEAEVMFTVDADAVPDMEGLGYLLEAIQRDDVDVVGGWSLMSGGADCGVPVVFGKGNDRGCPIDVEAAHAQDGLHELKGGGLGTHCLMAKRHVLERFKVEKQIWFEDVYYDDPEEDGKKFGTRRWGHDLRFCLRAQDFGFRVWCDNRVFWGHIKPIDLKKWYEENAGLMDEIRSHAALCRALRKVWGNEAWTAGDIYLLRLCFEAHRCPKEYAVVECGSGLSTLVLSQIVPPERLVVLENDPGWAARVQGVTGLNGSVVTTPLVDRGEYDWYALPDFGGRKVGLVACDGPRGDTRGGRVGALHELGPHLGPEFKILLDDTHRAGERAVVENWLSTREMKVDFVKDGQKEFAVLFGRSE